MGEERPSTVSQQTQEVGQESRRSRGYTDPLRMGAETWGKVCVCWGREGVVLGGLQGPRLVLPGLPLCIPQALISRVWRFGFVEMLAPRA